jgi:hypothetical protein
MGKLVMENLFASVIVIVMVVSMIGLSWLLFLSPFVFVMSIKDLFFSIMKYGFTNGIKNCPKDNLKSFAIFLTILFIIYFGGTFINSNYQEKYNECEQEIINERYLAALDEWESECKEIRDTSTGANADIRITNIIINNNSVGNEWYTENWLNGVQINGYEKMYFDFGETITVETYIAEDDRWPDSGKNKYTCNPTKDELLEGFEITQTTHIYENNGRYKGNRATWETKFVIKAEYDYPEKPSREDFLSVSDYSVKELMKEKYWPLQ